MNYDLEIEQTFTKQRNNIKDLFLILGKCLDLDKTKPLTY